MKRTQFLKMTNNSMNWRLNPAVFALVLIALIGCSRTAGEGGTTTIQGSVEVEKRLVIVNPASAQAPHPAADQDVFIIYGDRIGPDDRVRTNYDGDFAFYGMRPGDYTIYVYSEDTLNAGGPDVPIIQKLTIEKGDDEVDLGMIRIYEEI